MLYKDGASESAGFSGINVLGWLSDLKAGRTILEK